MRRYSNRLVARQVVTITQPGMHADGSGLYLRVRPNGTRSWVFVAVVAGRHREMGLGIPRDVSLAQARELAANARRAFAEGRDPIAERAAAKRRPATTAVTHTGASITFWAFAEKLIEDLEEGFKRDGPERQRVMTLATDEFIRRFLLHVLPRGFHRIRHYGLLAGSARKACLALARRLLEVAPPAEDDAVEEPPDHRPPCPCCGGHIIVIEVFER